MVDIIALLSLYGSVLAAIVSALTIAVLILQTIILWRQNSIQATQLRLAEHVSLSAEPIVNGVTGRMRINFENEGKGTADLTNVNYTLTERGTNNSLTGSAQLQSLGSGRQADIPVPEIAGSARSRYESILVSWNGTGIDHQPFNGSRQFAINQVRIEYP